MRDKEKRKVLESRQRIQGALARELLTAHDTASPDVFWLHVEGLQRIAQLVKVLEET